MAHLCSSYTTCGGDMEDCSLFTLADFSSKIKTTSHKEVSQIYQLMFTTSVPSPLLPLSKEGTCIKVLMRKTTEPLAPRVKHRVLPVAQLLAVMCIYLGVVNTGSGWFSGRLPTTSVGDVPTLEIKGYNFISLPCTLNKSTVYKVPIVLVGVASVIKPLSELIWHSLQSLNNTLHHIRG